MSIHACPKCKSKTSISVVVVPESRASYAALKRTCVVCTYQWKTYEIGEKSFRFILQFSRAERALREALKSVEEWQKKA